MRRVCAALATVSALGVPVVTAGTVTVTRDAYVSSGTPGQEFGDAPVLKIRSGAGLQQQVYLLFDLSTLPGAGAGREGDAAPVASRDDERRVRREAHNGRLGRGHAEPCERSRAGAERRRVRRGGLRHQRLSAAGPDHSRSQLDHRHSQRRHRARRDEPGRVGLVRFEGERGHEPSARAGDRAESAGHSWSGRTGQGPRAPPGLPGAARTSRTAGTGRPARSRRTAGTRRTSRTAGRPHRDTRAPQQPGSARQRVWRLEAPVASSRWRLRPACSCGRVSRSELHERGPGVRRADRARCSADQAVCYTAADGSLKCAGLVYTSRLRPELHDRSGSLRRGADLHVSHLQ